MIEKTLDGRAGEHMERELRRSRSTLQTLGAGVIGFALWDIVKMILVLLTASPETKTADEVGALLGPNPSDEEIILLLAFLALLSLLLLLSLALRIRIGRAARAEGLGRPHRGYVGAAFVFFVVQLLLFAAAVWYTVFENDNSQTPLQIASELLLELCSMVTMGELCFTARRVRRLERLTDGER